MKLRQHILLAIALSASMSAIAGEMVNARIVDSKTWTTGNVKSYKFIDGAAPNIAATISRATATASVSDVNGYAKTNTPLTGNHSYYIENTTKVTHMYTYEFKLCADGNNCIYRLDHIDIGAGGHTTNSTMTQMVHYFDAAGTYDSLVSTKVSGEASAESVGHGHMYIRKLG